jgi:hypothetical protein
VEGGRETIKPLLEVFSYGPLIGGYKPTNRLGTYLYSTSSSNINRMLRGLE